jgi:hypothetical protein
MTRKNPVAWLLMAVFVAGTAFAQSPAPDAAASPAAPVVENQTDVNIEAASPAAPAPVAPAETRTDVNINSTETTAAPAPAQTSTTSTTVWGFDGKTVLIGGALLLGIILIAVAAAGRESDRTTVVR